MISLREQVLILLYSFFSGIIFGIGFDLYRVLIFKAKNVVINIISSIIFWTLIGIGVFLFLLYTQYAILSLYTYFYIFLGSIFYLKFISKLIFNRIINLIENIFKFILRVFKFLNNLFGKIFNEKINKNL